MLEQEHVVKLRSYSKLITSENKILKQYKIDYEAQVYLFLKYRTTWKM